MGRHGPVGITMDVAHILRQLWLRRWLMLLGVLLAAVIAVLVGFRVTLDPPAIKDKQLRVAVATTQILVDTPQSALTDLAVDLEPLGVRASVYSRFATALPVRRLIAQRMGVPVEQIVTEAPLASNQPRAATEPVAADRSDALLDEQRQLKLRFATDLGLPTIRVQAQAGDVATARKLADAGAQGFRDYVRTVQRLRKIPPQRRVTLRQLGSAEGGFIGGTVRYSAMVVAFSAVLIGWSMLVLLLANVRQHWRRLEQEEARRNAQPTVPMDAPPPAETDRP